MNVDWKDPGDAGRLRELILHEPSAKQRDRYRVVLLAGEGLGEQGELKRAADRGGGQRSRQFVDQWGRPLPQRRNRRLWVPNTPARAAASKLTIRESNRNWARCSTPGLPPAHEGLAAYNGPILCEKIAARFGKVYSLPGCLFATLHRLGYNDLMPRTTHPDTDPATLEVFKKKSSPRSWIRSGPPTPTSVS